jgi:hypothetical protein
MNKDGSHAPSLFCNIPHPKGINRPFPGDGFQSDYSFLPLIVFSESIGRGIGREPMLILW